LGLENDTEGAQYRAKQGDKVVAYAEYRPVTGAIMFTHTEVNEDMEGKGVASKLIRYALDDVRKQKLYVIPMCPFVSAFIQRHHDEYIDLVNPQHRRTFGL